MSNVINGGNGSCNPKFSVQIKTLDKDGDLTEQYINLNGPTYANALFDIRSACGNVLNVHKYMKGDKRRYRCSRIKLGKTLSRSTIIVERNQIIKDRSYIKKV